MNTQEEIMQKQNEEKMLRCQYAARVYFNHAETLIYVSWLFSILSALTIFIPSIDSTVVLVTPLIIDIIAYLSHCFAEKYVALASKLRNYFDAVVLNINTDSYSDNHVNHLWEKVNTICHKHPKKCQIQINNSGIDYPPGVKNWYEFSEDNSEKNPVFECQRQNCWWNNKLCKKRICLSTVITIFLIIFAIVIMKIFNIGAIRILICFAAILLNLIDSIRDNIHYIHISMKMDAIIEIPDTDKNPSQIEFLQGLICNRREILVLEINLMHKINAKKWTNEYKQISRDSSNNV